MGSSKNVRCKRRQAARRKRKRMLRRRGKLPVHTRTERIRSARERQRQREAGRKQTRRVKKVAAVAVAIVGLSLLGQAVPAAASTRPAAVVSTARNLYRDYLSRQAAARVSWPDRPELPRDDGPDMTQDAFVPFILTGAGPSAPSTPHYPFYSAAYGSLPGRPPG